MGLTPALWVTSGFYRIHLWVLLGLMTLASLALYGPHESGGWPWPLAMAIGAALVSYVGAVIWMYERPLAGKIAVWLVALLAMSGCLASPPVGASRGVWEIADRLAGGLVLGTVTTAMLLGHWYLNTPTMKLAPLKRLVVLLGLAMLVRAALAAAGGALEAQRLADGGGLSQQWMLLLSLRWLAGLVCPLGLAWMTWQTLKIPNTQSATGILYAAVILSFIGELTAQLLGAAAHYAL